MKKTLLASLLGLVLISPLAASAAANDPGLHFLAGFGLTHGGEKLYDAQYTDGSSEKITSGGFFHFTGGGIWQSADMPLATSFTIGYHFDKANAENGSITFDRVPLEGLAYYTGVQNWRFGGGVRYSLSPTFTYDVNNTKVKMKFKDSVGAVIEAGYGLTPNMWINLRYVVEKFEPSNFQGDSIDGSHVGLNLMFQF